MYQVRKGRRARKGGGRGGWCGLPEKVSTTKKYKRHTSNRQNKHQRGGMGERVINATDPAYFSKKGVEDQAKVLKKIGNCHGGSYLGGLVDGGGIRLHKVDRLVRHGDKRTGVKKETECRKSQGGEKEKKVMCHGQRGTSEGPWKSGGNRATVSEKYSTN